MMDKIVRKALYTAVGIVAGTTERLQNAIDELVSKGKISAEDGKKVVDDVVNEKRIKSLEVKLGLLAKELESQRKAAAVTNDANEKSSDKKSSRKSKKV
jgi:polyhydroxyalkanoate synthesis regulator phasin